MGKIRNLIISLIMIILGSTFMLAGCDEYRKLAVDFADSEVVVYLSDNPEENIFSLSATVSGAKKNVSTDVTFDIHTAQSSIEQYGSTRKNGDTTTIYYRARSKGTVQVYATTKEGNKSAVCTVVVKLPIKDVGFKQETLLIGRGIEKDFSSFVKYTPVDTSQTEVTMSVVDASNMDEMEKIHVDGTKVLVDADSTITSFTLQVTSVHNSEITNTVVVDVVDIINKVTIEAFDGTDEENPYVELDTDTEGYVLELAQNVDDSSMFKKLIKIKGYIQSDNQEDEENEDIDIGYLGENSDYEIRILKYDETTKTYSQINLPYNGDHVEISKQLSNGAFQILQRSKGAEKFKILIDYVDHVDEFTQEIKLTINVQGLPKEIKIKSLGEEVDSITLFKLLENSQTQGTSLDMEVIGVNGELMNTEPILLEYELDGDADFKVITKNKYGDYITNFLNPITTSNDSPLLLSHNYEVSDTIPTELTLKFVSVRYPKVSKTITITINMSDVASITLPSELRISNSEENKELKISYVDANNEVTSFDNKLLKINIGNTSIIELNEAILQEQGKVVFIPKKVGKTTLSVSTPNGVRSRTINVTVFEELLDTTTIKVFDTTLYPTSKSHDVADIVVKTHGTYQVKYNINEKYSYLLTDMESKITTTSSIFTIVDGAIVTNKNVGTGTVNVKITGYDSEGELVKTLEYKFNIIVKAPLISAEPNKYIETIYDKNEVLNYEDTLAKRTIRFTVSPTNASYSKDDMTWIIKVGSTIIEPWNTKEQTVGSSTIITYMFNYNNNIIYIEVNPEDLKSATIYATLADNSLVFNAICQIRQTFKSENGVETTSVNEDVNITFTVLKPTKVSSIVLNNVKQQSVTLSDGTISIKNCYTFDTRNMTVDKDGTFTSGNTYEVSFSMLPTNATVQELSATHSQSTSDLEVVVDNVNKVIKIKVNRQIDGETIIYLRSKDSVDSNVVEQQIYLKVANGSVTNPFEVANAADFEKIKYSLSSHYVLVSDINLQSLTDYEPIGTADTPFTGTLNGQNTIISDNKTTYVQHTIYNLTIKYAQGQLPNTTNYLGMFGFIGETGAVVNINLEGVNIEVADSNSNQDVYIGAIAGFSKGLIYNCTVRDSSAIEKSSIEDIFEDNAKKPGINYRTMGSFKYAYVGGIVGMLIGTEDVETNFSDRLNLINDQNANINTDDEDEVISNFKNNKAYMDIVAYSTIPTGAITVGGLVGYNLGAKIISTSDASYDAIVAVNTHPTANMNNVYSVVGGLIGTNFGTIDNYTAKTFVNGQTYAGGLIGINYGGVTNNTVLPIVRGKDYTGGLIAYNVNNKKLDITKLTKAMFPDVYIDGVENNIYKLNGDFYNNIFTKKVSGEDIVISPIAKAKIIGNKVQFVDNANINLKDNNNFKSIYNTAIIGEKYVGGLIGASFDDDALIEENSDRISYTIEETISSNSVYSYFIVSTQETNKTGRIIYNYSASSKTDNKNKYYGDIVSIASDADGAVGGLIGLASHANITKSFVNANINISSNDTTQNVGGLVGKLIGTETNNDAILRIADSHTNGVVIVQNKLNNIGAFVGDASKLHKKSYRLLTEATYNGNSKKFYNIQSSYSLMKVSEDTINYVSSVGYINGFSGNDTTIEIEENSILIGGQSIPNDSSTRTYTYDNITAINSFYIGFTIKYLESSDGSIDLSSNMFNADYNNIQTLTFEYDAVKTGYTQIGDEPNVNEDYNFYYFNQEYGETGSGKTISYANFRQSDYIPIRNDENIIVEVEWTNVTSANINAEGTFTTYYVKEENELENGFGDNSTKVDFGNGEEYVINTKAYNWYKNDYVYTNPTDSNMKFKTYNGFPVILALEEYKTVNSTSITYANELKFVVDLPPMGVGVELISDNVKSFVHDIEGGKEILLTISELDSKYYNTDGTLNAFDNYSSTDKILFSNQVKENIDRENTYILKDIINITALPKFVGSTKLQYRSVNGLVSFGYDSEGNETIKVLGAGKDQIEITSLYNTEVSYVANINIISKLSNIKLLQNKRATSEITTIECVKNVETSFYADINSIHSMALNSKMYDFELSQRQNVGTRYYFTHMVGSTLSIYFNVADMGNIETPYKLNDQEVIEEIVNVNGESKLIRYVDILANEVSILGTEEGAKYSTILAVPYIILDQENFFKVTLNDVENIASSFTEGVDGMAGTFSIASDIIKPLQIRVFNKTFSMSVDKPSTEFSAFTEPFITVTLTTDNFDEQLYYVVSNGMTDSGENNAETNNANQFTVALGNLQVSSYAHSENRVDRKKTYQFKLNVTKINGLYNTIENNENYTITFYTKDSNGDVEFIKTTNITILPQPVSKTSILHYPSSEYEEVVEDGKTTFVPKANEVAYDNIIPGYMGLLKINLSPYYANINNVVVESSVVNGVSITFEQLVYEENIDTHEFKYLTAYPQAQISSSGNGIIALKRSNNTSNGYEYDGNIYIRTILPSSVVSGTIFTISVTVYAYSNGELVSYKVETLDLEAICPPELHITYKGSNFGVVARGTSNTIRVTGDGIEGNYIDFDKYTTLSIYNGATEYGVSGKVRISKVSDNEYTLTVASDVPQGSTIVLVGYTEKTINDKLYTSRSELKLKVADFVVESITVENVFDGVYQSILNQTQLLRVEVNEISYNPSIAGMAKKIKEFTDSISTKLNSRNENATWYQRVYNLDGTFNDASLTAGDYGTFVIDVRGNGNMYIRNTVKNSTDVLVAKAIINYSFGTSPNIQLGDPNEFTMANPTMDESFIVELECEFSFNVTRNTEDETPEPISTAEQFVGMEAGINYILTNDIVLTNYKPLDTEIASLDGNGYVITINDFDLSLETDENGNVTTDTSSLELGLFSTIAEGTIIKNLVIEIVPLGAPHVVDEASNNSTQDLLIDASAYDSVSFGFVAATNEGTITNVQVVNDSRANEVRREREALLLDYYGSENYTAKVYTDVANRSISIVKVQTKTDVSTAEVAGLVATNNGYITNSCVENITINGAGYVAGIAVRNNGTISSTYYKGANLLNQSSELIESAGTAGLVVFNSSGATIQYCYTMAREGWSYTYDDLDEDNNMSNGKITYYDIDINVDSAEDYSFILGASSGIDYIKHRDITGISATEKNLFTGVYNSNTLTINDGTRDLQVTSGSELYKLAMITLLNESDMFTYRAVNSGINVDTDAAGFVFQNEGTISNSYANMLVNAAHSAGFVFTSGDEGIIEDCYSLSSVRIGSDAHSPFTGKTLENTESSYNATTSNINYSHYLKIDQSIKFTDAESKPYTIVMKDKFYDTNEPATNLEAQELLSYNSFQGYAFNNDFELNVDILRNVWFIPSRINASSYSTYEVLQNNFKHSYYAPNRPELISANLRTLSIRVLLNDYETSSTLQYEYIPSLVIGESIRNPYLVYNAKTFNDYGTMSIYTSAGEVNKNYIRFISDITFDGESVNSIKAETYNTAFAGDIDGNGMTINELKLIAESNLEAEEKIDHLGLFGKLYSFKVRSGAGDELSTTYTAIVRNLNINVKNVDGTGVMYVGVLAGEMIDSYAFNIKVYADEEVYINGQNAVGGVVGKISGNSELVNVTSNVSVAATNKNTLTGGLFNAYDGTEETLKTISYAGGIAGIVDVNGRTNDVKTAQKYARIRKLDVYGNTTISGDIVGGIFGYVGTSSTASDVHFTITNDGSATPRLVAKYSAGGITGEHRGKIERSYIAHSNQSEINEDIKANINKTTHSSSTSKTYTRLFNGSSMAESYYIGGIAGMNIGGTISDTYSNVDVINGISKFAGGVVGLNIGGTIKSVYTTASVKGKYIGGFIGLAVNGGLLEYEMGNGLGNNYQEDGLVINNIIDLVQTKLDLSSLILNSVVSANIWRQEDLDSVSYDNIGSFIGKIIDRDNYNPDGSSTSIISTSSKNARKLAEVNVFTNATKTVNGRIKELKEIGSKNSTCNYEIYESDYSDSYKDDSVRYNSGIYGVIKNGDKDEYYYYSRMKEYGSLRTIEEIISRTTSSTISKGYETAGYSPVKISNDQIWTTLNVTTHQLPNIYKGWSSIYWEGTGVNNVGNPDSDHVLPSLIARPNVSIVRVYTKEDLKLMTTLRSSEFVLINDIDMSGEVWTPVGTDSDPFTGSIHSDFDSSNNYNSWTILNLSIASSEGDSAGLLGTVSGATLKEFNVNITSIQLTDKVEKELHIGGLVGMTKSDEPSTIENVTVIGGSSVEKAVYNDYTKDDKVEGIGTNYLYFTGSSEIVGTNIVSIGGVVGTAINSEINNCSALNLHLYAKDEATNAGSKGENVSANAIGGVVGYYSSDKMATVDGLYSKNIYIGNGEGAGTYNNEVYFGGAIGYGNSAYLRNTTVYDFAISEQINMKVDKAIHIGGIAGDFTGIVFNAVVSNNATKDKFTYTINANTVEVSNKIDLIINTDKQAEVHVGGGFGLLSDLGLQYEASPVFFGSTPARSDSNPFGEIATINGQTTGQYMIETTSNAIITEIDMSISSNASSVGTYVGGVAGRLDAPIYNAVTYGDISLTSKNDSYMGGIAGYAQNDFIQNSYSNRVLSFNDPASVKHDNSLHIGGGIGYLRQSGGFTATNRNELSQNVVSTGEISIKQDNFGTSYIGGLLGKAENITLLSSISNTNITFGVSSALEKDYATSYVGGFVGYFLQNGPDAGYKYTMIKNSYCTGTIALATNSYQNGGAGGFVGKVVVQTSDKYGDVTEQNTADIRNCYTISRIIPYSSASANIKKIITTDTYYKGGFVGNIEGTFNPLTNCFFNKEIFSTYENSTNELLTKRYISDSPVAINYGLGLTLDDMLYGSSSILENALTDTITSVSNETVTIKDSVNPTLSVEVDVWHFEENAYPTLTFYFESKYDVTYSQNSIDIGIPYIVSYNYTNPSFGNIDYEEHDFAGLSSEERAIKEQQIAEEKVRQEELLKKYNITYLLGGVSVNQYYTYKVIKENEVITGYTHQEIIEKTISSIKSSKNTYGIQSVGTEQNPLVISDTNIDLTAQTDSKYNYDFTDQAVIIVDANSFKNKYSANSGKLENATLLFKPRTGKTLVNNLVFVEVDTYSLIYGLKVTTLDKIITTNNGEINNLSTPTTKSLIEYNNGVVNNLNLSSIESNSYLISTNNGVIDTVKFTRTSGKEFSLVNINTMKGFVNAIQIELKDAESTSFDASIYNVAKSNAGVVNNYMIKVEHSKTNSIAYKYKGNTNSSEMIFASVDTDDYIKIDITNTNRTYIAVENNTRAHAIDVFSGNGSELRENISHLSYYTDEVAYDFANDWVIITGLNNNMPLLRNLLRDNYYDQDLGNNYYFGSTEVTPSSDIYSVDTAEKMAYVGEVISNATTGTITLNITKDIDLAGKIWKPINIQRGVTVNVQGNGHTISNISVIEKSADAGLFGTSLGLLRVNDLLMKDGYTAVIGGYAVDKSNSVILSSYDIDNLANSLYGYSAGSVVGKVNAVNKKDTVLTLSRVGNQYVYVAGSYKDTCQTAVGGLVGLVSWGRAGILNSYVNSPFMSGSPKSAGLAYANSNTIQISNNYVANYDIARAEMEVAGPYKYATYELVNKWSNETFSDNGTVYKTTEYNYYLNDSEVLSSDTKKIGATLDKLRTHTLPEFDWSVDWVRIRAWNDGLPYSMFKTEYWIEYGAKAVNGTDYTVSGSTYTIKTENGLAWLAYYSDQGNTFEGKTINLESKKEYDMAGKLWTPIGGNAHNFKGTFNGNSATISNLSITQYFSYNGTEVVPSTDNNNVGFFGVAYSATIKDIILDMATVTGNEYVGGIVGSATDSIIESCTTDTTTTIVGNSYVGGIAGFVKCSNGATASRRKSVVSNATNNARVSGHSHVGGIVGRALYGITQMSTNYGTIKVTNNGTSTAANGIGGIVGSSEEGAIYEVINNGSVYGYDAIFVSNAKYVGGIVGDFNSTTAMLINAQVNNNDVIGSISGSTGVLCGNVKDTSLIVMAYSTQGVKIGSSTTVSKKYIGNSDTTSSFYGSPSSLTSSTPMLTDNSVWSGTGNSVKLDYTIPTEYKDYYTTSNTFTIDSKEAYQYLNYVIHKRAKYNYENKFDYFNIIVKVGTYEVVNNYRDASEYYIFSGEFKSATSGSQATFNISDSSNKSYNHGGLFGVVQNATFKDIKITTSSTTYGSTDYNYMGMFAGRSNGYNTFTNITIDSTATLYGNANVGGIVGNMTTSDKVESCTVKGITISAKSYFVGGVIGNMGAGSSITSTKSEAKVATSTANSHVGGIVGKADGENTSITNCTASGYVTADTRYAGGIAGSATGTSSSKITITGNTYSGIVYGKEYLGGIVGYMTYSTVTGNTMNGNIYVYRTDSDSGKVNKKLPDWGFGYSLTLGSDNKTISATNGSPVEYGKINGLSYANSNKIHFVVGNDKDIDSSNTLGSSAKIYIQDEHVRYSLSWSNTKVYHEEGFLSFNDAAVAEGTATISAQKYLEIYLNTTYETSSTNSSTTKSISNFGQGSVDTTLWVNASETKAFDAFKDNIEGKSFDFTGTW